MQYKTSKFTYDKIYLEVDKMLSEEARKRKVAYNVKRTKELYKQFSAKLLKNEYEEICNYLKSQGINKAEFVRWAYSELKSRGEDFWQ